MSEVDRARRAAERGDGRTWRERALAAEARLAEAEAELKVTRRMQAVFKSDAEADRDRYRDALELADRYFTLEDERDRGEGGAGIYREMRRAIRAAIDPEPEQHTAVYPDPKRWRGNKPKAPVDATPFDKPEMEQRS